MGSKGADAAGAPRLRLLVDVLEYRPKPFFPMDEERATAVSLAKLGLLSDVDESDPGCFILTPEGERMLFLLERMIDQPIGSLNG